MFCVADAEGSVELEVEEVDDGVTIEVPVEEIGTAIEVELSL